MSLLRLRLKRRLIVTLLIFTIIFIVLVGRLTYLQVFSSVDLMEKKLNQLIATIPITASRGNIYDRNMEILAKDATSTSIYARPRDIEEPREVASDLSKILGLEEENIYKKLNDVSKSIALIKRKVDNDKALEIRKLNIKGLEFAEDKKRYYKNGHFAPYVLGFTGVDHQGLYGIEGQYDGILKGKDGLLTFQRDARGSKISTGIEERIAPVSGQSLMLTLDGSIQYFAERAAEKAMFENDAKRVTIIVMDPNNGDLLAMANKPDYDLNNPRDIPEIVNEKLQFDFTKKDENGEVRIEKNLGEKQQEMWKNPAVAFNYEPGSTFKIITSVAGLEEGVVTPETPFYDKGFIIVGDRKLKCWRYPRAHGSETFKEAVQQSCNPVFVEVALKLGADRFYKYIDGFGFGVKTGIDLDGEEAGIVPPNNDVKDVSLATRSYGQGITATPIQLITAVSAVANDGVLMKPRTVKGVIDQENNEIVKKFEPQEVQRVISSETSKTMMDILETVVSEGTGSKAQVAGYNVGGKTGTANKVIEGRYGDGKYVASFVAVAPTNDPKISVLVVIDEPNPYNYFGGQIAAPVAGKIIEDTLKYLNISPNYVEEEEKIEKTIVPNVRNLTIEEAAHILSSEKLSIKSNSIDMYDIIIDQSPLPGVEVDINTKIELRTKQTNNSEESKGKVLVPNVLDKTIQEAHKVIKENKLNIEIVGNGISIKQKPSPGEYVNKGTQITVEFKPIE